MGRVAVRADDGLSDFSIFVGSDGGAVGVGEEDQGAEKGAEFRLFGFGEVEGGGEDLEDADRVAGSGDLLAECAVTGGW